MGDLDSLLGDLGPVIGLDRQIIIKLLRLLLLQLRQQSLRALLLLVVGGRCCRRGRRRGHAQLREINFVVVVVHQQTMFAAPPENKNHVLIKFRNSKIKTHFIISLKVLLFLEPWFGSVSDFLNSETRSINCSCRFLRFAFHPSRSWKSTERERRQQIFTLSNPKFGKHLEPLIKYAMFAADCTNESIRMVINDFDVTRLWLHFKDIGTTGYFLRCLYRKNIIQLRIFLKQILNNN